MNEDMLISKNEMIEKAAYGLCCTLLGMDPEDPESERKFPKDMEQISEVIFAAEEYLKEKGHPVCHPFFTADEIICSKSDERCSYCRYGKG